jgi:hypothetical protein
VSYYENPAHEALGFSSLFRPFLFDGTTNQLTNYPTTDKLINQPTNKQPPPTKITIEYIKTMAMTKTVLVLATLSVYVLIGSTLTAAYYE